MVNSKQFNFKSRLDKKLGWEVFFINFIIFFNSIINLFLLMFLNHVYQLSHIKVILIYFNSKFKLNKK